MRDGRVVGRGDASPRPDGRTFLSIDSWHDAAFDQLAEAMLADLAAPLHTLVDEADRETTTRWARAGFTSVRRESEYLIPTGPQVDPVPPPAGVTILPVGAAQEDPLRELHATICAEVDAAVGWESVHPVVAASQFAVAVEAGRYVGLVRVATRRQHARIGLIAVRADARRRGIARALLAHVLESLHHNGIEAASVEVNESDSAAVALVESIGARRVGGTLELVYRRSTRA